MPIIQKVVDDAIAKAKAVAHEKYRRIAGVVESRNVENRLNMTPEEYRATLLSETEDVAREDQIFLREGAEMAMAQPKYSLQETNDRFNAELDAFKAGQNVSELHLGIPSPFFERVV